MEKVKRFITLFVVLIVIVVGVVGYVQLSQMSRDAQGLIAGLLLGFLAAALPMVVLAVLAVLAVRVWLQTRMLRAPRSQPPVVVVGGGGQLSYPQPQYTAAPQPWSQYTTALPSSPRRFDVIGEE